ncbi:MAG: dihydrolipoyl dehydrogenase family protein [Thermoprotei archaeon]
MYDVIYLGGGPGGYAGAVTSALLGKRVALVEKKRIGGTCVNFGCIPADTALSGLSLAHYLEKGNYSPPVKLSFSLNLRRAKEISERTARLAQSVLESLGVDIVIGEGTLAKGGVKVGDKKLEASSVVIATGARQNLAPVKGADPSRVLTFERVWELDSPPQRVVVYQGGFPSIRGLEIAQLLAASGSDVTVIDENSSLFPQFDEELTETLKQALEQSRIKFDMGARVGSLSQDTIRYEVEGKERVVQFDAVLPSHAWIPNVEGLGLQELGIITKGGFVAVDEHCRTNVPSIYAVGEVSSFKGATRAMYMGRAAAYNAAGIDFAVNHQIIPSGLYTLPQFAEVGMTEKAALESGLEPVVGTSRLEYNEKAMAMGAAEGLVKLIFDRKGKLIGGGLVGYDAEELVSHIALAIKLGASAKDLAYSGYEHASISESIGDAASKALLSLSRAESPPVKAGLAAMATLKSDQYYAVP